MKNVAKDILTSKYKSKSSKRHVWLSIRRHKFRINYIISLSRLCQFHLYSRKRNVPCRIHLMIHTHIHTIIWRSISSSTHRHTILLLCSRYSTMFLNYITTTNSYLASKTFYCKLALFINGTLLSGFVASLGLVGSTMTPNTFISYIIVLNTIRRWFKYQILKVYTFMPFNNIWIHREKKVTIFWRHLPVKVVHWFNTMTKTATNNLATPDAITKQPVVDYRIFQQTSI